MEAIILSELTKFGTGELRQKKVRCLIWHLKRIWCESTHLGPKLPLVPKIDRSILRVLMNFNDELVFSFELIDKNLFWYSVHISRLFKRLYNGSFLGETSEFMLPKIFIYLISVCLPCSSAGAPASGNFMRQVCRQLSLQWPLLTPIEGYQFN